VLARSPLAQRLTQKKLAALLRRPLAELKGLIKYKKSFVVAEVREIDGKARPLCYPRGPLRSVNEALKYQLTKIRLPDYVASPRRGRGQRENAAVHVDATQILTLDLRKFYPSVSRRYIARFFRDDFSMHPDVAGLITELLTFEGRVLYGAPATPILVMLAHRKMFDQIEAACLEFGTRMSLWVDNLTISGTEVPGALLVRVREIVASHGYKTHDVEFMTTNRDSSVTGVVVRCGELHPANSSNLAIRDLEGVLRTSVDPNEFAANANRLLSRLGGQLHILGTQCDRGQRIARRMNVVRQKRDKRARSSSK
jgi:RNA-directed DNA polymerase